MQDRIRSLEQQLKSMKGHVDVAKSKTQLAMDGEKFLLEEMNIMSQHLECKCLVFSGPSEDNLCRLIVLPFVLLRRSSESSRRE